MVLVWLRRFVSIGMGQFPLSESKKKKKKKTLNKNKTQKGLGHMQRAALDPYQYHV